MLHEPAFLFANNVHFCLFEVKGTGKHRVGYERIKAN